MVTPMRSLIIIDHLATFRDELRFLLYGSGYRAIWCHDDLPEDMAAALSNQTPDVLLIGTNISIARMQIADVKRLFPACRVVLLAEAGAPDAIEAALEYRYDALIPKDCSSVALHATLELVLTGFVVMSSRLMDAARALRKIPAGTVLKNARRSTHSLPTEPLAQPVESFGATPNTDTIEVTSAAAPSILGSPPRTDQLTPRELDVLQGVTEGLPNKQIAQRLDISESNVKVHVKSILRKLVLSNRTQVAMWAMGVRRVDPPC